MKSEAKQDTRPQTPTLSDVQAELIELRLQVANLQVFAKHLAERVVKQSELLARVAMRKSCQ